jgi:hypothetical protein
MAVERDRVHRDLGARDAAVDDHVKQVVVPVEAVDVHATLAVTVSQRWQARSLRLIHLEHRIATITRRSQAPPTNFVARRTPPAGLLRRPAPAMSSRCGASSPDDDGRMSPEDYRQGTDGRLPCASTAGRDCERIRRFTEEHPARILRSHTRTDARDWANDHRSTSAAAPMLSHAVGHGLRGTGASATPLKGTDATASRHVRGTLRGQP